jgi:hypothetical protein
MVRLSQSEKLSRISHLLFASARHGDSSCPPLIMATNPLLLPRSPRFPSLLREAMPRLSPQVSRCCPVRNAASPVFAQQAGTACVHRNYEQSPCRDCMPKFLLRPPTWSGKYQRLAHHSMSGYKHRHVRPAADRHPSALRMASEQLRNHSQRSVAASVARLHIRTAASQRGAPQPQNCALATAAANPRTEGEARFSHNGSGNSLQRGKNRFYAISAYGYNDSDRFRRTIDSMPPSVKCRFPCIRDRLANAGSDGRCFLHPRGIQLWCDRKWVFEEV